MARVRLDLNAASLQDALERDGQAEGFTRAQARRVAEQARELAPSRTGKLRQSIDVEQRRDTAGRFTPGWAVVSDAPYALYVHEGTRPHVIRARRAAALVFYWEKVGAVVAFRQVNHPGTRAQPFLRDALDVLRR